ncbi:LytTR family transcriptional regulator DNA-binding domain-containing protein [Pedobacter glucosidilyticus]|uniref:LytTR family transcriptional regulator DNA-binding domain-containing protein n=1 Tax=Pedobacter glucosidilyticus TaxID=1122941 RepID=UPI0026F1591E|nr:LytTR family transcriptional regulator DNA-binding domain-containing protein [Pedobacter glucosidilyticus]
MNKQYPKYISYFHWYYRLLAALFISFYLNTPTQYQTFLTLVKQRNYQEAFIFTLLMSFIVIWGVHYSTLYLDKRLTWAEKPLKRSLYQFLLGVVFMVLLCYIAARSYFFLVDGDILLSDYMVLEFPLVQAAILVLNMLYFGYYMLHKLFKKDQKLYLKGSLGKNAYYFTVKEILYLQREGKIGYAILKNGKKYIIDYKMCELELLLSEDEFFRINRSIMVALDAVTGYKPVKNGQCELLLKEPVSSETNLTVTRARTDVLKKILEKREIAAEILIS